MLKFLTMIRNIIFLSLFLSSYLIYSQVNQPRYIKVKYLYIIDNVNSESQLNDLSNEFKKIKGVNEVKFEFKPEKHRAKAIIYTTQKVRQSEADEEFKITDLKQAILRLQMMPYEFREEIIE